MPAGLELPEAGEAAARRRWAEFLPDVGDYDDLRNDPGRDATSRMSVHLKYGEIHPRTMLADLAALRSTGAATYRKELAWREFYADVLHAQPGDRPRLPAARVRRGCPTTSPATSSRPGSAAAPASRSSTPGCASCGRTGWMHNRVRMIVASFLVKDLHLEWQHGARHFMQWLVDGDLASNQHGWQWTAGCGHRRVAVLPGLQPDRAEPEVRPAAAATSGAGSRSSPTPTRCPTRTTRTRTRAPSVGYPSPIVDHAEERREALDRWERIRS